MSWNHRVLAHIHKEEVTYKIHEVYYDDKGIPDGYTESPRIVLGEDIKALEWVLDKMKECLSKPILMSGDDFPKVYKPNPVNNITK